MLSSAVEPYSQMERASSANSSAPITPNATSLTTRLNSAHASGPPLGVGVGSSSSMAGLPLRSAMHPAMDTISSTTAPTPTMTSPPPATRTLEESSASSAGICSSGKRLIPPLPASSVRLPVNAAKSRRPEDATPGHAAPQRTDCSCGTAWEPPWLCLPGEFATLTGCCAPPSSTTERADPCVASLAMWASGTPRR